MDSSDLGTRVAETQYQEWLLLRERIDARLAQATSRQDIAELVQFLAEDSVYQEMKHCEGQLILLNSFVEIWMAENCRLPESMEDIFYRVNSLKSLVYKYRAVVFCALRIENHVPGVYVEQAVERLVEQRVSGVAIGKIIVWETKERENNMLSLAEELKRHGQIPNAILLLQYAREKYPEEVHLALAEADCRMQCGQWDRAYEILAQLPDPVVEVQNIIEKLRQVVKCESKVSDSLPMQDRDI